MTAALHKTTLAAPPLRALESLTLPLSKLSVSDCNVRTYKPKDIATLAASIAKRGLLQSLLVRTGSTKGQYEVVAGQRRYNALVTLAKTAKSDPQIPCLQLADDSDAAAIEASLEENSERQDMDPIDRFDAIAALIKAGRSETDAADQLGMTPASVAKHLALAKLIPGIKKLYRAGELEDRDLHVLTLAPKAKQQDYISLHGTRNTPSSYQLRQWITGSHRDLLVANAKFPLYTYTGHITKDLFGDSELFADAEQFWRLQREAVTALRQTFLDAGWTTVKIWDTENYYRPYDYKAGKKANGAEVHIVIEADGKVTTHTGRITVLAERPTTRANDAADGTDTVQADALDRPELTAAQTRYVDAIRYAAVRAALTEHPAKGARWMIAHLIGGHAENLNAKRAYPRCDEAEEIAAVEALPDTKAFATAVSDVATTLGLPNQDHLVGNLSGSRHACLAEIYQALSCVSDTDLLYIATLIMAETLAVGSNIVELVGQDLSVIPAIDAATAGPLVTTLRGSDMLTAILAEVGSKSLAKDTATSPTAKKKELIAAQLAKAKEPWAAKWLQFPAAAYTDKPVTAAQRDGA